MGMADTLISARLQGVSVREAMGMPATKPVVSGATSGGSGSMRPRTTTQRPLGTAGAAGARQSKPRPMGAATTSMTSGGSGSTPMGESFGMGLFNEVSHMKEILHKSGYALITDDAEYGRDVVAGRERYQNPDGTQVHLDLSPNDNSPGKRGAFVFHMRERAIPGFGARQLSDTIMTHHRRASGRA